MQITTADSYIHIMKYMGSKRELLEAIRSSIDAVSLDRPVVLDIFAGTCGVGMALKDAYGVISNDVQVYSKVIAEACIEMEPVFEEDNELLKLVAKKASENYSTVVAQLPSTLEKSRQFIALPSWNEESLENYLSFLKPFSEMTLQKNTTNGELSWLLAQYTEGSRDPKRFPYVQTTFLFGEMYFSLEQAIAIDSIRYAINHLPGRYNSRIPALLAALIHAHSYASAGTGHFAQFRNLDSVSSVTDVFKYRPKSVATYFERKYREVIRASAGNAMRTMSSSVAMDYEQLLNESTIMRKVGAIYADPPYTFVHYSRFYHAVEDLCRYDYPEVEFKGRYRKDRHQSPFCIKTKAPRAFKNLFTAAKKWKVPLIISYSNTGMITLGELAKIAADEGFDMRTTIIDHRHSTMGRSGDKDREVAEGLLTCHPL